MQLKFPIVIVSLVLTAAFILTGCATHASYHDTPLGDPAAYDAHFPDMDANGDGSVDKTEFKTYFPQSNDHVYKALDLNADGAIDHDEWHQFKEAHGMKHHS